MTLAWPGSILRPRGIRFSPRARTRSGGASLTGIEQIVSTLAGVWSATLSGVPVRNAEQIKLWRSIEVQLDGRSGKLLVPLCDSARAPFVGSAAPLVIPFSDGSVFSDGTAFSQPSIVVTVGAASLGATELVLTAAFADPLEPGMHFSIGERLYRIAKVISQTGQAYTVQVWPRLREAVAAGATANFDRPVCLMSLESDDGMDLDLDLNNFGRPSVSFVERL